MSHSHGDEFIFRTPTLYEYIYIQNLLVPIKVSIIRCKGGIPLYIVTLLLLAYLVT